MWVRGGGGRGVDGDAGKDCCGVIDRRQGNRQAVCRRQLPGPNDHLEVAAVKFILRQLHTLKIGK